MPKPSTKGRPPAHVRQIEQLTDGFIVGSALVKAAQGGVAGVRAFATELRGA